MGTRQREAKERERRGEVKRWVGIRHGRYLYHAWRMAWWYAVWAEYGYVGPAESDRAMLDRIWRGED